MEERTFIPEITVEEVGEAKVGLRSDEVVIGLAPAFLKYQNKNYMFLCVVLEPKFLLLSRTKGMPFHLMDLSCIIGMKRLRSPCTCNPSSIIATISLQANRGVITRSCGRIENLCGIVVYLAQLI